MFLNHKVTETLTKFTELKKSKETIPFHFISKIFNSEREALSFCFNISDYNFPIFRVKMFCPFKGCQSRWFI